MFPLKNLTIFLNESKEIEFSLLLSSFPIFKQDKSLFKYFCTELKWLQSVYSLSSIQLISIGELYELTYNIYVLKNKNNYKEFELTKADKFLFKIFDYQIWPFLLEDDIIPFEDLIPIKHAVWKSYLAYLEKGDYKNHISFKNHILGLNIKAFEVYFESQIIVYILRLNDSVHISNDLNKYLKVFNKILNDCYLNSYQNTISIEEQKDLRQEKLVKILEKIKSPNFELNCSITTFIKGFFKNAVREFSMKTEYVFYNLEDKKIKYLEEKTKDESVDFELLTMYVARECLNLTYNEQVFLKGTYENDKPREVIRKFLKVSNSNFKTIKSRALGKLRLKVDGKR